jgi:hypothetical protein
MLRERCGLRAVALSSRSPVAMLTFPGSHVFANHHYPEVR